MVKRETYMVFNYVLIILIISFKNIFKIILRIYITYSITHLSWLKIKNCYQ